MYPPGLYPPVSLPQMVHVPLLFSEKRFLVRNFYGLAPPPKVLTKTRRVRDTWTDFHPRQIAQTTYPGVNQNARQMSVGCGALPVMLCRGLGLVGVSIEPLRG